MAITRTPKSRKRSTAGRENVHRAQRGSGAGMARGRAREARVATDEAWNAVKEAVRSGKTQPTRAARATGKAVRNMARSGAKQTSVAAETIARAAEELLISAIGEARTAAKAAREAAAEVERSVTKAFKAIDNALRKRARVAVMDATRKRRRAAVKKA